MSVSGRNAWTQPFDNQLFDVVFIDPPTESDLSLLKAFISDIAAYTVCFFYEPLVQGSAGMLMHSAIHLDRLMQHCRKEEVLLIQDEVFTGFGRTRELFLFITQNSAG